jgi:hypothetical protein
MAILLLERSNFLTQEVMKLDNLQMQPLADPLWGRYPTCALCKYSTLAFSNVANSTKSPSEIAVKLPCSHVFGRVCINKYFNTVRPDDMLYNDRCPECNVLLYTQRTGAERYEQASKSKEVVVYACFFVIFIAMFFLCLFTLTESDFPFSWQWVFFFGFLGLMAAGGAIAFRWHVDIRKELIDLEKERRAETSTTWQEVSPQKEMCNAEASTEMGASLGNLGATDERKTSHSDDGMAMVGHDEDEERAGLLSNKV